MMRPLTTAALLALATFTSAPLAAQAPPRDRSIVISVSERQLWLMEGRDTLLSAPVGVGKGGGMEIRGRRYDFETPRGTRRVLAKEREPLWVPPDWHYYEKARARGLDVVHLERDGRYPLSDGSAIELRGLSVGRTNEYGNWWEWTPGMEIILENTIFVPPIGSPQRRIDEILGTHKLDLGAGYLIHGTDDPASVGLASSHGCVRMNNGDVALLYTMVDVGTPVFIR